MGFCLSTPPWTSRSSVSMSSRDTLPPSDDVARLRVAVMGLVCMDLVGTVANFPSPDAKIRTTSFEEYCGGNAANSAVAVSRLGISTKLISAVGDDGRGLSAVDILRASGVDENPVENDVLAVSMACLLIIFSS